MKRMNACSIALSAVLISTPVLAQGEGDREGVRRAALDYLEGFYEGDSTKHIRSIRPDVFKYGFWIPQDSSKYSGQQMTWPEFHAYTRRVRENKRFAPTTAPKEVVIYEVLDQIASAKVTAFWGVDYLLLAKHDGKWMISHVLWQTPPRK